jgi:hypothetical protein
MLATILAAHLLVAQTPAVAAAPFQADDNPYEQPPTNPPLPSRSAPPAGAPSQPTPAPTPIPPPSVGATPPPAQARSAATQQLSLLSAEPLGGNAAALAWAAWSSLGVAYAMGITPRDDLGAEFDLDWAKTEMRLGAFYRRPLGTAGPFDMAGRLGLSWYANFGGGWIYSDNHSDRGFELAPALVFSTHGGGGIFSLAGEFPITITVHHGGGMLFTPRAAASYEAPLYDELTIGVRASLGYRAGAGDAPLSNGSGDVQFLVLAGYRVL